MFFVMFVKRFLFFRAAIIQICAVAPQPSPVIDKNIKTGAAPDGVAPVLARCKGYSLCSSNPCVLDDRCFAAVPVSHFAAENDSPDRFLYAAHPLRLRIPCFFVIKTGVRTCCSYSCFGALQGIRTPDLLVRSWFFPVSRACTKLQKALF